MAGLTPFGELIFIPPSLVTLGNINFPHEARGTHLWVHVFILLPTHNQAEFVKRKVIKKMLVKTKLCHVYEALTCCSPPIGG